MFSPWSLFIGTRYTGAKSRSQLGGFISLISIAGMVLGVALLILVLSVMNGFDREMRSRILGLVPHVTIFSYGGGVDDAQWQQIATAVNQHPEVKATAPFVQLNAMLMRGTEVEGVLVYGIDPDSEQQVSIIGDYVDSGALGQLRDQGANSASILLGRALAERLQLQPGDSINLMAPGQGSGGNITPRFSRLQVAALIATGTEVDQSLALISIGRALSLVPVEQQRRGLRAAVSNTFEANRIGWELSQNLPFGFSARDWTRTHGNLYNAIQLSKQLVGLMLLTIIAVAAFNVISALVMIVTDKQGDIAILRTLGASPRGIMAVFMIQGTLIALAGTLLGTLFGVLLSLSITEVVDWVEQVFNIHFLNSDVYPVDYLPSDLRATDVLMVCATAFAMSVLATLYPAWKASRIQPAAALRYE